MDHIYKNKKDRQGCCKWCENCGLFKCEKNAGWQLKKEWFYVEPTCNEIIMKTVLE